VLKHVMPTVSESDRVPIPPRSVQVAK